MMRQSMKMDQLHRMSRSPNTPTNTGLVERHPMALLDDLRRLATADQAARRHALLLLLREIDAPFALSRERLGRHRPENITVRFQEQVGPRLVLGAHYDSVPGSTGANDNGAGVVVLLTWLRLALTHPPNNPLDVVFFDLEELGQLGSQAYLDRVGAENVLAMINLDICGVGDTILVAPRHHVERGPLQQPLQNVASAGAYPYEVVDLLPPGDDLTFERADIPNISVCILPWQDREAVQNTAQSIRQGRWPRDLPTIWETMHNGRLDSIQSIEEQAMQQIFTWLEETLKQF
jgi:aminopeptidase YwaD